MPTAFHRRTLTGIAVLMTAIGCGTAVLRPYVGEQQAWPIASGSIVINKYKLPIFTSLPPEPYEVIGELTLERGIIYQKDTDPVPVLVKRAAGLGADALLFVNGKQFFSTNYGPQRPETANGSEKALAIPVSKFDPLAITADVSVLAIRWIGQPPPGLRPRPAP